MAGTYPDIPGRLMALEADGTQLLRDTSHDRYNFIEYTGYLSNLAGYTVSNRLDWSAYGTNTKTYFTFIFPELRDLDGYFLHSYLTGNHFYPWKLETSVDTTNGQDGAWVDHGAPGYYTGSDSHPQRRDAIQSLALTGIKALRVGWDSSSTGTATWYGYWRNFHLYGSYASGENLDRLMFYDQTLAQEVPAAFFDFGDLGLGTLSSTKQFRIHNNSSSLTASDVVVRVNDPNPNRGFSISDGLELSLDNTNWFQAVSLGNLASSTTSAVVYVRCRVSGVLSPSSTYHSRLHARADGGWA